MTTFLQLVNDVARESGTMGGQTIPTVTGASGRWVKLVGWTRQAWEMIQRERGDWTFLRKEAEVTLVIGQPRYTAAELGLSDVAGWGREVDYDCPYSLYDPAIGRADENRMRTIPYRHWRDIYDIGVHDANRPSTVSVDDERRLCVGPTPDKAYKLRLSYRRAIQSLTGDSDEPYIHEDYHAAVMWRALMLLGDDDESAIETASSAANYLRIRDAMLREYTEEVTL